PPRGDAASGSLAIRRIHSASSSSASITAMYSVKRARRVRGTMPQDASLRTIFVHMTNICDYSRKGLPHPESGREEEMRLKPAQQHLIVVMPMRHSQCAGSRLQATI